LKHTERALDRGSRLRVPSFEFIPLPGSREIDKSYFSMGDQKENTCGAYAATYLLRGLGYHEFGGEEISEDLMAALAGVNISPKDSLARKESESYQFTKDDGRGAFTTSYLYKLPTTDKDEELGASAYGVGTSIEQASNQRLAVIPLPSTTTTRRRRGKSGRKVLFTRDKFRALISAIMQNANTWKAQMILNLECSHLLDPVLQSNKSILDVLLEFCEESDVAANSEWQYDKWKVGHFVSVMGFFLAKKAKAKSSLYFVIRDTYRKRGHWGVHLQPEENVRKALIRTDGREGGILLIVDRKFREKAKKELSQALDSNDFSYWNNGSPFRPVLPIQRERVK
jgi:hypothetical protein